jgi:16S rRNA (cytosine967-C5)-methyltransferase
MAADMADRGLIVAGDQRARRMRLLATAVRDSGASHVALVQMNAAAPMPFGAFFDAVLVDAPCSGLGTLRRDPDIKWRRSESELERFARVQAQILASAAGVVKTGGRLIYSTCSSEPDENEHVVEAFLAARRDFEQRPVEGLPAELITGTGALRTLPFRDGLEGFFAAQLVKVDCLG